MCCKVLVPDGEKKKRKIVLSLVSYVSSVFVSGGLSSLWWQTLHLVIHLRNKTSIQTKWGAYLYSLKLGSLHDLLTSHRAETGGPRS